MPIVNIVKPVAPIKKTAKVLQLQGLLDIPESGFEKISWDVNMPIEDFDWNIGLIVGSSGSGKSTIIKELFPDSIVSGFEWSLDKSIVDDFPSNLSIKTVTQLLSSVGFNSPPNWLRPFCVLSNGEQFRVTMARALAEFPDLAVIDEFTSVVDRTVAQVGSHAISKSVKRLKQKLIAVTCHYDVIDWLEPDWVYDVSAQQFARGCLRRPKIELEIKRVGREFWQIFKKYHYLSAEINKSAHCYAAFYKNNPVCFVAVLSFPHATHSGWREHRLVCHPDFQGIGIGNAVSNFIASVYKGIGKPYYSVTANPALIYSRSRSHAWNLTRTAGLQSKMGKKSGTKGWKTAQSRLTVSFQFAGHGNREEAKNFGLISG